MLIEESEKYRIFRGDCLEIMKTLPDESVDALITDPPSGIGFMGKEWDKHKGGRVKWIEWLTVRLEEAYRVLKPGGHAVIWSIPRTSHWTGTAIEEAGFEMRDTVFHLFGQGMPKSHNISKAIDRMAGAEREVIGPGPYADKGRSQGTVYAEPSSSAAEVVTAPATDSAKQWEGWGTALKPACEMWFIARKPMPGTVAANVLEHGTGGLNIEACFIEAGTEYTEDASRKNPQKFGGIGTFPSGDKKKPGFKPNEGRWPANVILDESHVPVYGLKASVSDEVRKVIEDYYDDYRLPRMPERIQGLSKPDKTGSGEVLFNGMLQSVNEETNRPDTPPVWSETHGRIETENAGINSGFSETDEGNRKPAIQGPLVCEGIQIHSDRIASNGTADNSRSNVAEKPSWNTGTSSNNGVDTEQTFETGGNSSSQERNQRRQPPGEFRVGDTRSAYEGTPKSLQGTSATSGGKRNIKVFGVHIPSKWAEYFEMTGEYVPFSAAGEVDIQSGQTTSQRSERGEVEIFKKPNGWKGESTVRGFQDSGGASRFFYVAKADPAEKKDNEHPTVKPVALMRYLCRLVTPKGGLILDCFAGSGTTGVAALAEGFTVWLIDKDEEGQYIPIIQRRMKRAALKEGLFEDFGEAVTAEPAALQVNLLSLMEAE